MTQLTAAYVLEKTANEQMECHGKRLLDEGTSLITETFVPGKFVYIYIDLHAVENELGGLSPLYRVYEIAGEEMVFDECYDTAVEALQIFEGLCEKYYSIEKLCAKHSTKEEEKESKADTIQEVSYVSVWNGGFKITSSAKWNTSTGEVFDITSEDNEYVENNVDAEGEPLEVLDNQYIELYDGTRIEVSEAAEGYYTFLEETQLDKTTNQKGAAINA